MEQILTTSLSVGTRRCTENQSFDIQPSVAVILNEFYENTERDNEVKIEIKKSL